MNSVLKSWGWNDFFERHFQMILLENSIPMIPARIIGEERGQFRIMEQTGKLSSAELKGVLKKQGTKPTVGDWVVGHPLEGTDRLLITHLLERQTSLVRREAGQEQKFQSLAANVDVVFIVMSANADFNIARVERFLTVIQQSGAKACILISKIDLAEAPTQYVEELKSLKSDAHVFPVSLVTGFGLDALRESLIPGTTIALIGSSGVGKSSLVNAMSGKSLQLVQEISDNHKGKHTTTGRHLFLLENGVCVIDTPGIREVGVWADEDTIDRVYTDIMDLGLTCKFTNCTHESEPGCAIQKSISAGELTKERLESYRKLQAEVRFIERNTNRASAQRAKRKLKEE